MAYIPKFLDSIITDAGRKMLLAVGAGNGTLIYTKASLTSQTFRHLDSTGTATGMSDESIRQVTTLNDQLRTTPLSVSPINDNTITVSANFDNEDLTADVLFNAIGWFAKVNQSGTETLIAITPTAKTETLAAGSPDHHSSQAILVDLNMAISNAANVDMTVNQAGYVNQEELNAWETRVEGKVDQKIADAGGKIQISINGGTPVGVGSDGKTINLDTMTGDQIRTLINEADTVKSVQNVEPSTDGNVDLSSTFYTQGQVDSKISDLTNQLKQIKETALVGKHFTNEADAKTWEDQNPNGIAFIDSNS